jgi:predicted DNA-binding transcriptional regulator YafY
MLDVRMRVLGIRKVMKWLIFPSKNVVNSCYARDTRIHNTQVAIYMGKLGRLVHVLVMLQQNEKITAKRLAEHFEVAERTIYRDIEDLIVYGIPIIAIGGPNGGFSLPSDYNINLAQLDQSQVGLMSTANIALSGFVDFLDDFNEVDNIQQIIFDGISKPLQETARKHAKLFYFDRSRWYRSYIPSDMLRILKTAVLADRRVSIEFFESSDSNFHKSSTVDPYGLVFKSDTWYLVGYCHSQQCIRRWSIFRVKSAEVQPEKFERSESFLLEDWWREELEAFGKGLNQVRLAIDHNTWSTLSRIEWKRTNRFFHTDTHVIIELLVDRDDWIVDIVMTCRGGVQVIEPPSLKEKVIIAAERLLACHKNDKVDWEVPENHLVDFESLSLSLYPFDN